MDKSAEAFRTISEVSDELDVPKHVLRFWEARFPQIKPMKRGGGRRYYRPEDVELLKGIRHLLHAEGYTIRGVQKILRQQGAEQVKQSAARSAAARQASQAATSVAPPPAAEVPAAAPSAARPRSAGKASAVGGLSAEQVRTVKSAIAELEALRRLLRGEPEEAQPQPAERPRKSRRGR